MDGGLVKKAIAYVFCFLLSQYIMEPDVADAMSRSVSQGLRISVCDILYILSALSLAGPSTEPDLDFDHLCASPVDLMKAARQRIEEIPTGQHLLIFFLGMYVDLTFPETHSFEEQKFMRHVCGHAETLILSLESRVDTQEEAGESEFVNQDMIEDEGDLTDEPVCSRG